MLLTVKMPDIGEGVVEGEVVEWLKKEGDLLRQDEPVVVVMTDKATVELPAPKPGILARQYFQPGQIAMKDRPLYDIEVAGEESAPSAVESRPVAASVPKKVKEGRPQASQHAIGGGKGLATPPVRHLAKQLNIDLKDIRGTGKGGRITLEDLRARGLPQNAALVAIEEGDAEKPLVGIRRLMAEKMKASKDHIPHFSYFESVDASRLAALREKVKEQALAEGLHATFMPFFIRALSLCIKKYPEINSSLDESANKLVVHSRQHIGVAVAGPQGLVVAVVRDVQEMTLKTLIHAYETLKQKATDGQLAPSETKGSTITVSNFGVLGGHGLWATPIINYPEAAILALDRIQKQPIVINGEVVVRDVLNVSWSFDHRFIDGEMAAQVSAAFCEHISNPASLL